METTNTLNINWNVFGPTILITFWVLTWLFNALSGSDNNKPKKKGK